MQQQHSVPQTAYRLLLLVGPWTSCPPHRQPLPVQQHSERSDCLYIAVTVRTNASGGRALYTQLGQEPYYLEQEEIVPIPCRTDGCHRALAGISKVL